MNTSLHRMRTLLLASAAIGYGMTTTAASAQDAAENEEFGLEEIIVTAQLRAKTMQDVPVAVSAFSGDMLTQTNTRDLRDLMFLVPAMNTTQSASAFQTVVNIRGIGTSGFNPGLEPSVGIYVDGVYRSRTGAAIGDFLSVERVEVLRGPQSTLFGKNTSAGVISFVTQKPDLTEAGGKFELTYGNYEQFIAKGTFTAPIIQDKLGIRISANTNKRQGFIKNLYNDEDVNDRNRFGLRGQILYEPSNELSIRIIGDYSEIDEACCAAPYSFNGPASGALAALGATVLPAEPFNREVSFNGDLRTATKDKGISGEINYSFEGATLTSITAYRDFTSDANIDADFTDLDVIKVNGELTDIQTFTQEIRLASTGDNTVDWLFGGFYSDQTLTAVDKVPFGADTRNYFDAVTGGSITAVEQGLSGAALFGLWPAPIAPGTFFAEGTGQVSESFDTTSSSWALFGQFDWHISDRLTLTGGLRYTKEKKTAAAVFDVQDTFAALDLDEAFVALTGISAAQDALEGGVPLATVISTVIPSATAAARAVIEDPDSIPPLGAEYLSFLGLRAVQLFPLLTDFDRSRSEDKWTGNVILSYDMSENVNTYASFSRGYKAGGFDTSRAASVLGAGDTRMFEFDPEVVDAWEVGMKSRFWDNRAQVNVALYSQKVNDFQSNLFTGLGFELKNAGSIRIKGIEVDSNVALTENMLWSFAAAYSDGEYISFENAPCPVATPGVCDLSGEVLSDAPKLTLSSAVNYDHQINDSLAAFWRAEIYYRSDRFTASDQDPQTFQDSTFMVNASVGLAAAEDSSWKLSFWVKNLTKENFGQIYFDSVAQAGSFSVFLNDPRTYGLTAAFTF